MGSPNTLDIQQYIQRILRDCRDTMLLIQIESYNSMEVIRLLLILAGDIETNPGPFGMCIGYSNDCFVAHSS